MESSSTISPVSIYSMLDLGTYLYPLNGSPIENTLVGSAFLIRVTIGEILHNGPDAVRLAH